MHTGRYPNYSCRLIIKVNVELVQQFHYRVLLLCTGLFEPHIHHHAVRFSALTEELGVAYEP